MRVFRTAVVVGISTPLIVLSCTDDGDRLNGGVGSGGDSGDAGSDGFGQDAGGTTGTIGDTGGLPSISSGGTTNASGATGGIGSGATGGSFNDGGSDGSGGTDGTGGTNSTDTGGSGTTDESGGAGGMGSNSAGAGGIANNTGGAGGGDSAGGAGGAGGSSPECGDGNTEASEVCYDAPVPYSVSAEGTPADVTIADWNGGGWPDVLVAIPGSGNSFFSNSGFGVLGASSAIATGGTSPSTAIAAGQFDNQNTNVDFVGTDPGNVSSDVHWVFGDGEGGIAGSVQSSNHSEGVPANFFVADFPGTPSSQDLVVTGPDCVGVWTTSGAQADGFFDAAYQSCSGGLVDGVLARLEGSGTHLVYSRTSDSRIHNVFLSYTAAPSTITPGTSLDYPVGGTPAQLDVADFDEDTYEDVVVSLSSVGEVDVMFSDSGEGTFRVIGGGGERHLPLVIGNQPADATQQDVKTGDFDGNGNRDIAVTVKDRDQIAVFLGDGEGGFADVKFVDTGEGSGPTRFAVGELNDDGLDDFVVVGASSAKVIVILSNE